MGELRIDNGLCRVIHAKAAIPATRGEVVLSIEDTGPVCSEKVQALLSQREARGLRDWLSSFIDKAPPEKPTSKTYKCIFGVDSLEEQPGPGVGLRTVVSGPGECVWLSDDDAYALAVSILDKLGFEVSDES